MMECAYCGHSKAYHGEGPPGYDAFCEADGKDAEGNYVCDCEEFEEEEE